MSEKFLKIAKAVIDNSLAELDFSASRKKLSKSFSEAAQRQQKPEVIAIIGPVGSGKTHVAKAALNAIDANQTYFWMNGDAINQSSSYGGGDEILTGMSRGHAGSEASDERTLLSALKKNPKLSILLDEPERAGGKFLSSFFTYLAAGYIPDQKTGKLVSLQQATVFLTSTIERGQMTAMMRRPRISAESVALFKDVKGKRVEKLRRKLCFIKPVPFNLIQIDGPNVRDQKERQHRKLQAMGNKLKL